MPEFLGRLLALFRRRRVERDIDDELAFHLAMRQEEEVRREIHPTEASLASRRRFGNLTLVREQSRDAWLFTWLESVFQDIRHASRGLRRSPAFAVTATITLGIGITATTVVFSVVDSLLFNPAPFRDSDRLVEFLRWSGRGGGPIQAAPMLARWREQSHLFEQVEAHWEHGFGLTGIDEPEIVWGSQITVGLFPMLGIAPHIGRHFAPDEADASLALISHGLWRRRFGGSREIVGQTMRLDDHVYTIIGVMPETFRFPVIRVEVWVPFDPVRANPLSPRNALTPIARLRDGMPFDEADRQVAALAPQLDPTLASMLPGTTARLATLERYSSMGVRGEARSSLIGDMRTRLFLLFGAAIVLLVLSAANAANLFLSRALARVQDVSVRVALGAGRARLLRYTLAEAFLIAAAASAVGIAGAAWIIQAAVAVLPIDVVDDSLNPVNLDPRAVLWSVLAATSAAILAGLMPATQTLRRDVSGALRREMDPRVITRDTARGLLVSLQTASAVVLLVVAGLMARSLWNVLNVDPGWSAEGVVVVEPQFGRSYTAVTRRADFTSAFSASIRQQPGIAAVAVAEAVPSLPSAVWFGTLHGEVSDVTDAVVTNIRASAEYFRTFGLRFAEGRPFAPDDENQPVAVVSRSIARRLWPEEPAVGRRLRFEKTDEWLTVVGVVPDLQMESIERDRDQVEIYRPLSSAAGPGSFPPQYRYVVVKADGREGLAAMLKQQARALDPDLPVQVRSSREILRATIAERELNTAFLIGFSLFGVMLAAAGVYALVAYDTTRRTHELGVRLALGATAADIVRVVVGRSLILAATGAAIGLVVALAAARFMTAMVFGISEYDGIAFGGAAAVLLMIAIVAAALPARRATKVDPIVALRCE
jgi:predicted permease